MPDLAHARQTPTDRAIPAVIAAVLAAVRQSAGDRRRHKAGDDLSG
jgi:hypothetical protein